MARITPDMPQRGAARNLLQVVDNYYRPARDRMGEAAMAKGFQDMSNFVGNEAGKAKKKQLEEISLQAQQDALQGDDPDVELSKVRNGLLFRSNSRAYNQTYAETMGKKAAIEFKENATIEYEKSGLKYSTDPNRFREWMNTKVHGFLSNEANQNPYFIAGAMPYIEQTTFNMGAAHMSNVSNQMEANHLAAIQKQADDMMMKVSTGEMSIEEGIASIIKLNGQAYGTGLSGPKSRKALISSFLSVADATDNPEMIEALLAAQESGDLKLTPDEWNAVTKQGVSIQRDINFRTGQKERAAKAQAEAEVNKFEELVTDFYNNPDNAGASFQQFLGTPIKEGGPTIGEMINSSPNSTAILKSANDAYKTVNTIYEIPKGQALANNFALTEAFDNGEINNQHEMLAWIAGAQKDGLRFNEDNFTHAYTELEKRLDPDAVSNTQTYKDYKQATLNRVINAMSPEGSKLTLSLDGSYQGTMADDIKIRFQGYLGDYIESVDPKDPDAIKAAIANAERSVMEFYKQNDPNLFNKQFDSFNSAVGKNEISWTANPYFAAESAKLLEEEQAYDVEQNRLLAAEQANGAINATEGGRVDIDIQAGNDLLFGDQTEDGAIAVPQDPAQVEIQDSIQQANEQAAQRKAQAEAEAAAEAEKLEIERNTKQFKEARLMVDASRAVEDLNKIVVENVKPEEFDQILTSLQERFNLTIPTNYQELKFLSEDLGAIQQETGLAIDTDVAQQLLKAAIARFK
jgi:hypothetical protein